MVVSTHPLPSNILETCDGLLYCFALWLRDVTGGVFWAVMLIAFCAIIFMSSQRFGTARSFGFASFSGLLGAILFATMKLLPWWIASLFILVGVIGLVVMRMNES